MKKLLALTALFTFVFALSAEIGKQQTNQSLSCSYGNRVFHSGESFTLPDRSLCNMYHCSNGSILLDTPRCSNLMGNCLRVGDIWSIKCLAFRCTQISNEIARLSIYLRGCRVNRKCYQNNDIWTGNNCTYTCILANDLRITRIISWGCYHHRQCHPVNSTWTVECTTFKCRKENNRISFRPISERCKDHNGVCRKVGERFPWHDGHFYHDNCTCIDHPVNITHTEINCD